MFLPLPNLDDRRWADLVEEGRSLIPLYAPDAWTDHNASDPGIMLLELFAWIAEMDIYRLNRVPERHRRKFLSLVGIRPEPPRPARTVVRFTLQDPQGGPSALHLPATTELEGDDPFGKPVRFRTSEAITVAPGRLAAIQFRDGGGFQDLTARWRRKEPLALFGSDPAPGAELYLGFSAALPVGTAADLFFTGADQRTGEEERMRLLRESRFRSAACQTPPALVACNPGKNRSLHQDGVSLPAHHSVRLAWEFQTGPDTWQPLDAETRQIEDDTRSFTLDGRVRVTIPGPMAAHAVGQVPAAYYYLRCRCVSGAFDAPPTARSLVFNGVRAEQAAAAGALTWTLAKNAAVEGTEPATGAPARFRVRFNPQGEVSSLVFDDPESPAVRLLDFKRPTGTEPGLLRLEAESAGWGSAMPGQRVSLKNKPVLEDDFRLFTIEEGRWRAWRLRPDLDASRRDDSHCLLDPTEAVVTFGDGERGRTVPAGTPIVAVYSTTRAENGNLDGGRVGRLADSPHNRALLPDLEKTAASLAGITNTLPAEGGAAAETLSHAEGRAIEALNEVRRAVTRSDFETLVLATPGTRVARTAVLPCRHPGFACFNAPGIITVIVVPFLPLGKPVPDSGLLGAVRACLSRRRVIGTRIEVVGPAYLEVAVRAQVQSAAGADKTVVRQAVGDALDRFFHPLQGGPDKTGWPFGRDVYRSEVLQVIAGTAGVDHVLSLGLIAAGGASQCGNVCLGPTGLVAAGTHDIEVV